MAFLQGFLSFFWFISEVRVLTESWHAKASFGSPLIISHVIEIPIDVQTASIPSARDCLI